MDDFAKVSGISKAYISLLEKDKHPQTGKPITPSVKIIKMAAQGMRTDFDTIFKQLDGSVRWDDEKKLPDGAMPFYDTFRIPMLGSVAAGAPIFDEGNVIGEVYVDPALAAGDAHLFALKVKGDSMAPKILDGDTLIVREQSDAENGDIVIVTINGEEGTCKKLQRYPDSVALISYNTAYEPIIYTWDEVEQLPVRVIGKVIQSRHTF
ncbi:MAG: hypothetical protein IJ917_09595 [Firmicutes bacterium]|nr:hypothetical protein [Bacillota bacterium]